MGVMFQLIHAMSYADQPLERMPRQPRHYTSVHHCADVGSFADVGRDRLRVLVPFVLDDRPGGSAEHGMTA